MKNSKINNKLLSVFLGALLISSMLAACSILPRIMTVQGSGESWLDGWQYRKSHVIANATGAGTNYQVKVVVDYGTGTDSGDTVYVDAKCQSDFDDIRFTENDGVTELDYWCMTKTDAYSGVFWVEVSDDLSSSNATIYVYYGNSTVSSASDLLETAWDGDDFEQDSDGADPSRWDYKLEQSYTVVEVQDDVAASGNKALEMTDSSSTSYYCALGRHLDNTTSTARIISIASVEAISGGGGFIYACKGSSIESTSNWLTSVILSGDGYIKYNDGGTWTNAMTYSADTWYCTECILGSSTWDLYINETEIATGIGYRNAKADITGLFTATSYASVTTYFVDGVFVGKYVSPEPAHSTWGAEEECQSSGVGESWLDGWSYRKSHVIANASGAGTNYQVKIVVCYGNGTDSGDTVYLDECCQTDFDDIRFTSDNGTTLLDYWMETKTDSDNAVFWVEVADDLSTSDSTIYMYYGNSNATTTSSGADTFVQFDDFTGNSTTMSIYNENTLKIEIAHDTTNDVLKCTWKTNSSDPSVCSYAYWSPVSNGYAMRMNYYRATPDFNANKQYVMCFGEDYTEALPAFVDDDLAGHFVWSQGNSSYLPNRAIDRAYNSGVEELSGVYNITLDSWNVYEVTWSSTNVTTYWNDTYTWSSSNSSSVPDENLYPIVGGTRGANNATENFYAYWDWILIRKFVENEPTHGAWGTEEGDWLNGWSYRKSHVIVNATGAGKDYQVKFVVDYGNGTDSGNTVYVDAKCQSDFDDIRFTDDDGVTLLDYWMETRTDGTNATFWVEVADDLSSSNATIYVYYGNANVSSASDLLETAWDGDDFEQDSDGADPSRWDYKLEQTNTIVRVQDDIAASGNKALEMNDYTTYYYCALARHLNNSISTARLISIGRAENVIDGGGFIYACKGSSIESTSNWLTSVIFSGDGYIKYNDGGTWTNAMTYSADTWYCAECLLGSSTWDLYIDGVEIATGIGYRNAKADITGLFTATSCAGTPHYYIDGVFVGKYVENEPSHAAWGAEESI